KEKQLRERKEEMLFSFLQSYLPVPASSVARSVDGVFNFTIWLSAFSVALLIGAMVFFVIKYQRRSDNDKSAYITHNTLAEFLWSFIPFVLFVVIFYWGWIVYDKMRTFPPQG